jgi:hypothetical protein
VLQQLVSSELGTLIVDVANGWKLQPMNKSIPLPPKKVAPTPTIFTAK